MRFFVKHGPYGQTHVIPWGDSTVKVEKLKASILDRLCPGASDSDTDSDKYRLSLAGNDAVIDEKDTIQDVLQDGDCLSLNGEQLLAKSLQTLRQLILNSSLFSY